MVRRSSDIRDFGVSQAALRHGRELHLPTALLVGAPGAGQELAWIRQRRTAVSRAAMILTRATEEQRRKDRRRYLEAVKDNRSKPLQVGELVLLYTPTAPSGLRPKLTTMWRGPHRILEAKSEVTFRIANVLLPDKPSQVVHVDRLKRYYPRRDGETQLEDCEAARQLELRLDDTEGQAFGMPADQVVDKRTTRGRVQYKVRWQGFPAQQDTWEDAEALAGLTPLIDKFMEQRPVGQKRGRRVSTLTTGQRLVSPARGGMWNVGQPAQPVPSVEPAYAAVGSLQHPPVVDQRSDWVEQSEGGASGAQHPVPGTPPSSEHAGVRLDTDGSDRRGQVTTARGGTTETTATTVVRTRDGVAKGGRRVARGSPESKQEGRGDPG
jgi:hypothetical protein